LFLFPTAFLLYSAILIDTRDLSPEKTTDRDREALTRLGPSFLVKGSKRAKAFAKIGKVSPRRRYFKNLKNARFDTTGMSVRDLLRLDYKQVDGLLAGLKPDGATNDTISIGASSIFDTLGTMIDRSTFAQTSDTPRIANTPYSLPNEMLQTIENYMSEKVPSFLHPPQMAPTVPSSCFVQVGHGRLQAFVALTCERCSCSLCPLQYACC
jgi:hypothetical protein